ncbi:MAG: hypothetical protein GY771_14020 [bacterium]|nr:hypothetical protein [bacterium]
MRRIINVIAVLITVSLIVSCDHFPTDFVSSVKGNLWMAVNFDEMPDYDATGPRYGSFIGRYDLAKQDWGYGFGTPFDRGKTYDMACGDGRAWVYGGIWNSQDEWYDPKIWEVGTPWGEAFWGGGLGMTYGDSYLWCATGDEFWRLNPDTHEAEDVFTYTNPRGGGLTGLAWVNGTLWAVYAQFSGHYNNNEFVQLDPETGEVLDSFGCIAAEPRGLAWDGEALWTSDYDSNDLYRIDPRTREVLGMLNPYWEGMEFSSPSERDYVWGLAFGVGPPHPED